MAIIIPGNTLLAQALTFNPTESFGEGYSDFTYVGQKMLRVLIVSSRRGATQRAPKDAYKEGRNEEVYDKIRESQLLGVGQGVVPQEAPKDAYTKGRNEDIYRRIKADRTKSTAPGKPSTNQNHWAISIVDLDYNKVTDQAINRPRSIDLMYMPKEMRETPKSVFAALAPLGRNNPHYQYTGSEDTLEFEIDWHSHDYGKRDVITYTRWIQALAKADGWKSEPHRVKLVWSWNPLIWRDDIWILSNVETRFTQFNNLSKVPNVPFSQLDSGQGLDGRGYSGNTKIIDTRLLPIQAYQVITLKKVTDYNTTALEVGQFNQYNFKK